MKTAEERIISRDRHDWLFAPERIFRLPGQARRCERPIEEESIMRLPYLLKHTATAAALAVCVFAVSNLYAAGFSYDLAASGMVAFSEPVSAPCHISLRACAKPEFRVALGGAVVAYPTDRWIEPVSAPCHPAVKRCRG
jgi:hypothetical protein